MTAKEKAESIIKKHLTAIAEESLDCEKILFYSAKQCALITVDQIIKNNPTNPIKGGYIENLYDNIEESIGFWKEVKREIKKL